MLKEKIERALRKAAGLKEINLEFSENEAFGDYSTNVALQLKGESPREQAQEIVEKLKKDKDLAGIVDKIEIAGPGFINFWLAKDVLMSELGQAVAKKAEYGQSKSGKGKTVIVDYSSPNIAKRFSIGHLRSTIIGQAIYNLYQFLGYKVIGDNHLGDWGTQFGTLLYQIDSKHLDAEKLSVDELEKLYVEFHKKVEENPDLWDEARKWFKRLEEGDPEAKKNWQAMVNTSLAEFSRIYKMLGVSIDYTYGESFYEDKMPKVLAEVREKGLAIKSKGAEIVEFDDLPPILLTKSDLATTYFTRDLATIKFRLDEWNPDIFIYEVGADQSLYFKQLFETTSRLGWTKGKTLVHIAHGLIRFEHGKMSTREGKTVKLEEVLDEAVKRARKIIDNSETGRGLDEKQKEDVAQKVGIGAVKYFDLSHQPTSDIIFDWEKMFVLQGNSGPYLQYTVARTNSVLAKSTNKQIYKSTNKWENGKWKMENEEELSVLRTLVRFPEVIASAAKNYSPNLLANYLFSLAQKYNNFYDKHRILGNTKYEIRNTKENISRISSFRITLTAAAGQVLKNGLYLLGIETPEKM